MDYVIKVWTHSLPNNRVSSHAIPAVRTYDAEWVKTIAKIVRILLKRKEVERKFVQITIMGKTKISVHVNDIDESKDRRGMYVRDWTKKINNPLKLEIFFHEYTIHKEQASYIATTR